MSPSITIIHHRKRKTIGHLNFIVKSVGHNFNLHKKLIFQRQERLLVANSSLKVYSGSYFSGNCKSQKSRRKKRWWKKALETKRNWKSTTRQHKSATMEKRWHSDWEPFLLLSSLVVSFYLGNELMLLVEGRVYLKEWSGGN